MPNSSAQSPGRRQNLRRRTRLRSGKIAAIDGNFLADCQIFDRSTKGARLRLSKNCQLPNHVQLLDDEFDTLLIAVVIWIKDKEIGVEFLQGPENIRTSGSDHVALAGRYYAVK